MRNFLRLFIFLIVFSTFSPTYATLPPDDFAKTSISIGVIVEDLQKSIDFYTKVIGMVKVREFVVDMEKAKRMGLSNGDTFDIKVLKLENSENASEWKLMSFNQKAVCNQQTYIPDDNGIRYVTLFVKSMAPILERIKKHGIKTLGETPTMLDEKRQFVLVQDPDGNFVELIGPE